MKLIIFGAQAIALGAYKAIQTLYPEYSIQCFLVSKMGKNSASLSGKLVMEVESYAKEISDEERSGIKVLIATPENVMQEIECILDKFGFVNHERLDSLRWAGLMEKYFSQTGDFVSLSEMPIGDLPANLRIFMAKFYKDRALSSHYDIPEYMKPIQVGAALCTEKVAEILDNEGDNISLKNVNYSELTGLYWIWKNCLERDSEATDKYYGLAHYRRILELTEDDLMRLMDNHIDVVLPYPMSYEPDIAAHPARYLKEVDWKALLSALEELRPEYAEVFPTILGQQYMYNYNIIIARKEVLRDYCRWLFPILERTEELSEPKGWERADRYIGYMGEILETLYFMYNKYKLKIVHTGCRFLI